MKVTLGCGCGKGLQDATREPLPDYTVDGEDMKGCGGSSVCGVDCESMLFFFNCSNCKISYKTYMCMF